MAKNLEPSPFTHGPPPDYELIAIDEERLQALFDQMDKDTKFLQANYGEWLEKYPDMTVVVYKEQLVAVGNSVGEIDRQLEEKGVPGNITIRRTLHTKPVRTRRVPI